MTSRDAGPGVQRTSRRGARAELVAARFLEQRGCRLLAHNVRLADGELDLILLDPDGTLAFVEVRHRRSSATGSALESLTGDKLGRLRRAASVWLVRNPEWRDYTCRFDIVALDGDLRTPRITWLSNAFGA